MSRAIVLDTGPLSFVVYPGASAEHAACSEWLEARLLAGTTIWIPELADYEVRRGMLRVKQYEAVRRLDALKYRLNYLPLTTEMMLTAAAFWAEVRNRGYTTADDKALDGDVILAAQTAILIAEGTAAVVATTNVKHIELLVPAELWRDL